MFMFRPVESGNVTLHGKRDGKAARWPSFHDSGTGCNIGVWYRIKVQGGNA